MPLHAYLLKRHHNNFDYDNKKYNFILRKIFCVNICFKRMKIKQKHQSMKYSILLILFTLISTLAFAQSDSTSATKNTSSVTVDSLSASKDSSAQKIHSAALTASIKKPKRFLKYYPCLYILIQLKQAIFSGWQNSTSFIFQKKTLFQSLQKFLR